MVNSQGRLQALFISGSKILMNTENFPIRTWKTFSLDSALFRFPEKIRKKIPWTLFCGNRKKKESLTGYLHGEKDVRDGILSAP